MRLIDADALIKTLNKEKIEFNADANYIILNAPTIEAEPVRHGMWKKVTAYEGSDFHFYECSICGEPWWFKMNYCAKCGARMDKAEE